MRIRRGGCTEPPPTARMPPKPSAASRSSSQTVTSRPAAPPTSTACSASQAGVLRLAGTVARARERHPAPPRAIARASSSSAPSSLTSASTMRPTGRSVGPVERQWKAKDPSIAPTTRAPRPSSGAIAASEVTTLTRSFVARASAAPARRKSVTEPSPTPTSSTRPTSASRSVDGHRDGGDLTGAPAGAGGLEGREQVDAEDLGGLVGTGARAAARPRPAGPGRPTPRPRRSGAAGPG